MTQPHNHMNDRCAGMLGLESLSDHASVLAEECVAGGACSSKGERESTHRTATTRARARQRSAKLRVGVRVKLSNEIGGAALDHSRRPQMFLLEKSQWTLY